MIKIANKFAYKLTLAKLRGQIASKTNQFGTKIM